MKLYTRTGDDGTTGLFGSQRVPKNHPRVEAYGNVDELNTALGFALAELNRLRSSPLSPADRASASPGFILMHQVLSQLQPRLFDLGADLATPPDPKHQSKISRISPAHVSLAESWIDSVDAGNAPLRAFIMPAGCELAARLHLARTIARRAERSLVTCAKSESINPNAVMFLNRVSDLLFALARRANRELSIPDIPWTPEKPA